MNFRPSINRSRLESGLSRAEIVSFKVSLPSDVKYQDGIGREKRW
jgi:hypothetical protein